MLRQAFQCSTSVVLKFVSYFGVVFVVFTPFHAHIHIYRLIRVAECSPLGK